MNDLTRQLAAPLIAAAFVGLVGWLSGFSVPLIAFVAIVVAFASFVPLRLAAWLNRRGGTRPL